MAGTNDLSSRSEKFIFTNLEKLTEFAALAKVSTLSIGIPDSGYIFQDTKARLKRDQVWIIYILINLSNSLYDCIFDHGPKRIFESFLFVIGCLP